MGRSKKNYEIDMTRGPLLGKLLLFALPLSLTGMLQLLYNAADLVVVGRFASHTALAAVSSTAPLISLLVNLFIGLSVGASVSAANHYGAGQMKDVNETVHTSICLSLIAGVAVGIFGLFASRWMLSVTATPEDVIDQATVYLTIYFAGMPASMVYNFGSAVLRAVGDTRRPLYYLALSGVVNVFLNLFFVIVFHMGAAGVGLATVISQIISAALVMICLCRSQGCVHLDFRRIRMYRDKLMEILRVGVPAGLQSTIFAVSNVMIQSSVNSFGSATMAGNGAAMNLDNFISLALNGVAQASLAFTSQNMGARRYRRIGKVMVECALMVVVISVAMGSILLLFGRQLLGFYCSTSPEAVAQGYVRLEVLCYTYYFAGFMDCLANALRGMGYSILPTLVTCLGVVGIRITWLYTVFASQRTLASLYMSYPATWIGTMTVHLICFIVLYRKLIQKETPEASQPQA